MTLPEMLLWQALKANDEGLRFRRQHPIGPYIADYYGASANLVVEADGKAHDMGDRPGRDFERDAILEGKGYTVLRISAADVLRDVTGIAESIVRVARPLRQPLRGRHLPTSGEDLA